ncbi:MULTISPECIES: DoxX-like family protein [unclassified Mesorhizobium]|uniref:DoxX-like family protein n=1 Tax=unclassified Mesorhizobium TaxID=325217 RepID=UPI001FE0D965|nr:MULTISPECIES: DoxX-like family protein [unclassified Mesorhizobium]
MPAHAQERWFARLWLLKPVVLAVLSLFWLFSGVVGLVRHDAAPDILISRGLPGTLAFGMVVAGSIADIVVGVAVVARPFARSALMAMIAITLLYLAAAAALAPDLWLDPLGAIVKAVPVLCLVLVALAILEER